MKKKIIIIIIFYFSLPYTVFAQPPNQENKIANTKWSLALNINTIEPITEAGFDYVVSQTRTFGDARGQRKDKSFSLGLNVSYKIKENCLLRFAAKINKYNIYETYNEKEITPVPTDEYLLDTGYIKQSVYSLAPGILWNLNYKKLNFYGGFQIIYKKYSPTLIDLRYSTHNSSNDTLTAYKYYMIKESGGYSVGIGPIAGFAVNIFKNISIGAEFTTAYTYYKRGGETNWMLMYVYPNSLVGGTSVSHGSYEAYKFSSIISSINLAINF